MIEIAGRRQGLYVSSVFTPVGREIGAKMTVDTSVTGSIEGQLPGQSDRFSALTAGMAIFGLSLLCWMPLVLLIGALVHR
jgi:hypothetical protein